MEAEMKTLAMEVAGGLVLIVGVVLSLTPIPLGLALIVIGMSMLASASAATRNKVRTLRKRHDKLDEMTRRVERRLPRRMRVVWKRTAPEVEDGDATRESPEEPRG